MTSKGAGEETTQTERGLEGRKRGLAAWGSAAARGQRVQRLSEEGLRQGLGRRCPEASGLHLSSLAAQAPCDARPISVLKRAAESNEWTPNCSQDPFSPLTSNSHPCWLRSWRGQEELEGPADTPVCPVLLTDDWPGHLKAFGGKPAKPNIVFPICNQQKDCLSTFKYPVSFTFRGSLCGKTRFVGQIYTWGNRCPAFHS